MKKVSFFVFFLMTTGVFFWFLKPANNSRELASTESTSTEEHAGNLHYVTCFATGSLSVRDEELSKPLFKIKPFSVVKPFQGWEETKKKKVIKGETVVFIKAQFPDHPDENNDIGWVAEKFVKTKSECIGAQDSEPSTPPPVVPSNATITGVEDPNCCIFPIRKFTDSFTSGMARFGHRRPEGRTHGACDLYLVKNAPIIAVADGKVIQDMYKFYQGTYALEVKHPGGFVVRYGELTGRIAAGISKNKKVTAGQLVGYMGKVNSNCCEPMLHFELYSGKAKGSLSGGGKYKRRSDLMNPTQNLLRWRKRQFGR